MQRAGMILVGLALLQAIALMIFGRDNSYLLASFGICMLGGGILLAFDGMKKLASGKVRIQPLSAIKMAPVPFVIMAGAGFLLRFAFPDSDRSPTQIVATAFFFAVFMSLYLTAYRKPA